MTIVSDFVDYLLDHGKISAAVGLAVIALAIAGFLAWRRSRTGAAVNMTATSSGRSQTTQVHDVRTKGDVTISPSQTND